MRISDWSSDVCSSDLREGLQLPRRKKRAEPPLLRPSTGAATFTLPKVQLADNLRAHLLQLRTQFAFDTLGVLRGVPFLIMLVLGLANLDRTSTRLNSSH